jgi:hypothetical protein
MSPVSVIAHLIAVALGAWGGWWLMDRASPDLPDPDAEAAVEAAASLKGGDPESLLRTGPLAQALDQLSDQVPAGEAVVTLRVQPGSIDSETGSGGADVAVDDIPPNAPERIVEAIAAQRPRVTLDDVQFMELGPGEGAPEWYVQLDVGIDPPRTYVAPLDGSSATPGG